MAEIITPEQSVVLQLLAKLIARENDSIRGPGGYLPYSTQGRPGIRARIIDLSTARNNEELAIVGRGLSVVDATDGGSEAEFSFNIPAPISAERLPLFRGVLYRQSFERLYITNTAQAGKTLTITYWDDSLAEAFNFAIGTVSLIDRIAEVDLVEALNFINSIPSGYTLKYAATTSGTADATLEYTLYTVPAGKTARLLRAAVAGGDLGTNYLARIVVFSSGGAEIYHLASLVGTTGQTGANEQVMPNPQSILLTAGQTVRGIKSQAVSMAQYGVIVAEEN